MTEVIRKERAPALLNAEFIIILLVHFMAMGSHGIYFFLPRFIRLTGGGEFLIGLIMGAPAMAAVLFRLPTGAWIDRFGRRSMVILGLILLTVTSAMPIFAHSSGLYLILARALAGGSIVLYFTAIVTYVAEKAPDKRRAEAIAIYGAGGFVALAISPYICEWLLETLPMEPVSRHKVLFALSTLCSILSLGLSFRLSPDKPHPEQHLSPDPWHRVIRVPAILYVLLPSLFFGTGFASIFNFVADFTQVEHLGAPSTFFLTYSVTVIILRLTTGRLIDRADRRLIVTLSLGILAAGLYYASISSGALDLIMVGILTGTGHGYIFPSLSTLTYDSSPARNRGISMAIYMLGFDVSTMLVSPLLGHVAELWNYFAMYRVSSFLLLAGLVIYLTGWRHHAPSRLLISSLKAGERDIISGDTGALR